MRSKSRCPASPSRRPWTTSISPSSPSIDKRQIDELATMRFLENAENVVFLGPPGVGKTHLASALGLVAAQHRFSTYYINCHQLIESSRRPTLRTVCRISSRFWPSTGCSSSTRSATSPWTSRGQTCSSNSLPDGMRKRPPFLPPTRPSPSGTRSLPTSPSPLPSWSRVLHHCTPLSTSRAES